MVVTFDYTAVQKKLLEFIFVLWKKDEAFDPKYQDKKSRDAETEPSLASVPKEPSIACGNEEKKPKLITQKITPVITRVTQDKHPSKRRRMPSLA